MSNLLQFPLPTTLPEHPPAPVSTGVSDAEQRAQALDTHASFIVEAPAGSGKTGLLVQRFLKLLLDPELDSPADVLAITFTNKATAELRERVLHQLQAAASGNPLKDTASAFERETRDLAEAVVRRDAERGWNLLERPQRLNIRSIDSACAALAGSAPLLSGSGGERSILPDAQPLYLAAARRTLQQLGGTQEALDQALRNVLLHRDGQLSDTERLLASMLAAREQWGELVPLGPEQLTDIYLDGEVRARLESVLESIVCAGLARATRLMPSDLLEELTALASRWSEEPGHNGERNPFAPCREWAQPPAARAEHLEHWRILIHLLLKKDNDWRKRHNAADLGIKLPKGAQDRLREIIEEISSDRLHEALKAVRELSPARYPDEQWAVTKALFHVLRHALAELKVLFAERGECDFAELSLAAREALRVEPTLGDLALAAGGRLRHLLVDEMQDTSASQYDLLEHLTRSWDGHTQTLFLVGDPKQSIYLFRQARVERFLRTMREGCLGELPLTPLRLSANFRSQSALVTGFNDIFDRLFPHPDDDALRSPASPDVPFVEATPVRSETFANPVQWHITVRERDASGSRPPAAARTQDEAAAIVRIISSWRQTPLPEGRPKPWRIAVLARGRNHLVPVATELRAAAIPYRAVEIESLAERHEVLDCLALTRALLQPADRIAWLAVLHAPWCGLTRADLLALTGEASGPDRPTVAELIASRSSNLSPEGQQLLDRAWPVLTAATSTSGRTTFATHVERTWHTLGGDAALSQETRRNASRYFALLREVEALGEGFVDLPLLTARLAELFAEPGGTEDDVQLMTIHKAKGLEWDVVLVPGLDRRTGDDRSELLNWLELDTGGEDSGHILLAPIQGKGEASDTLNAWLRRTRTARERAETKRVFYVACTRAREELHLFAALEKTSRGELSRPAPGSLLQSAWPAAEPHFEQALQAAAAEPVSALHHEFLLHLADEPEADHPLALAAAAAEVDELAPQRDLPLAPPSPPLRRLPLDFNPAARFLAAAGQHLAYTPAHELSPHAAPARPEGSFAARAFGNVVHRFIEHLTLRLAAGETSAALLKALPGWEPRVIASLRGEGISPSIATRESARVLAALRNVLDDPIGQWILAPHAGASSEASWSSVAGTLRADRILRAGAEPATEDNTHLWIVDFKTTERGARTPEAFAAEERAKYETQMERYAATARAASGHDMFICLALYYPLDRTLIRWCSNE